jgi:hypothetical protein
MKMRVTMFLPVETEAGSAGMQPCRGIAWRAHRDDVHGRGGSSFALFPEHIGSVDPHALKIPARRAEYSLTDSASPPVHAEPAHVSCRFALTGQFVEAVEDNQQVRFWRLRVHRIVLQYALIFQKAANLLS